MAIRPRSFFGIPLPPIAAFRLLVSRLKRLGAANPILLKDCLAFEPVPLAPEIALLRASVVIGSLLADGIGDAILVIFGAPIASDDHAAKAVACAAYRDVGTSDHAPVIAEM